MKRIAAGLALVFILLLGAASWLYVATLRSVNDSLPIRAPQIFTIAPHSSLSRVAGELSRLGVMPQPRLWVLYARCTGLAAAIKAGEYEIALGATPRTLLQQFVEGRVLLHPFTIVEGWRVQDLLDALRDDPNLSAGRSGTAADVMHHLGSPEVPAEGQFLPETYLLPKGAPVYELLRLSHIALVRELHAAWANRDPTLPLATPQELLTLASIVEKETGLPAERAKIAGVYVQRLKIGMRLQADPTVIYGLGARYDGDIRTVDLRTDTPYNTYTRTGLPPTPICLPGIASITAAAHPQLNGAIFFVANGLGDGGHTFTSNLKDHNAAVALFLKRQRDHTAQPQ